MVTQHLWAGWRHLQGKMKSFSFEVRSFIIEFSKNSFRFIFDFYIKYSKVSSYGLTLCFNLLTCLVSDRVGIFLSLLLSLNDLEESGGKLASFWSEFTLPSGCRLNGLFGVIGSFWGLSDTGLESILETVLTKIFTCGFSRIVSAFPTLTLVAGD